MPNQPDMNAIARQLRQPTGELGREVARRMNESNRVQNREAERLLNLAGAIDLLEIGMGNGGLVAGMLERQPWLRYMGVDFSADMVREASELNADLVRSAQARFQIGEASALPIKDSTFDRVLTVNTLYFWPDPDVGLREIYRVLAPGGRLVVAVRSPESMQHFAFVNDIFTLYGREKLEALFGSSPFGSVHIHALFEEQRTSASGQTGPAESLFAVAQK